MCIGTYYGITIPSQAPSENPSHASNLAGSAKHHLTKISSPGVPITPPAKSPLPSNSN